MRRSLLLSPALIGCLLSCVTTTGCHHCRSCGMTASVPVVAAPAETKTDVAVVSASPYAAVTPGPVVHAVLKPAIEPEAPAPAQHEWRNVSVSAREKLLERRTFTDVTANPAFAHAPDYSWLVGELRSMGPGVWSVRFASVDEDRDTVVLVDAPPMVELHPGQLVRVEGQLVDPASREANAGYRVNAIHAATRE
jgi:hypothetical protein